MKCYFLNLNTQVELFCWDQLLTPFLWISPLQAQYLWLPVSSCPPPPSWTHGRGDTDQWLGDDDTDDGDHSTDTDTPHTDHWQHLSRWSTGHWSLPCWWWWSLSQHLISCHPSSHSCAPPSLWLLSFWLRSIKYGVKIFYTNVSLNHRLLWSRGICLQSFEWFGCLFHHKQNISTLLMFWM